MDAPPAAALPAPRAARLRLGWIALGAWAAVVLVICARVAHAPAKQSSYAADYAPAGRHWQRGQEVYKERRGFVYSPPVAAAFVPFAALPLAAGGILWRLAGAGALAWAAARWLQSGLGGLGSAPAAGSDGRAVAAGFLLLLPLAAGNVNLGQINVVVLALTAGGVLLARAGRWNAAALLFAAGGFIKIYPLAVGLLAALLYPRRLAWRLALAVAALFAVSLALQRPGYVLGEYRHWFATLGADDRLDLDLYASWRDFPFLLRASGVPLPDRACRLLEAGAGLALAGFLWRGQRCGWGEARLLGGVFALGCAWMVLFGPATEAATYVVLALPVCAALVAAWTLPAARGGAGLRWVLGSAYVLLLGSDLSNAWFHRATHHLYLRALQPVAGLIFAAGMVWWLARGDRTGALAASPAVLPSLRD